ncbi:ArnT family glycosyltransferase [Pseudaestuariivita rosea]|uniref:ArnT family glycosyltransferase n=1 Tax=Pseudaestuariivita rosea TaxID=2763263 RepID=UPI001ABBC1CC|nr:phospholipid carrier-dependent glycosyltransferase [Pseudaestuariivita rosea]
MQHRADSQNITVRIWVICVLLIAAFVVLRMPFALWQFEVHSDEQYYSIGAAKMMATGDYLVPRGVAGDLRLKKPPLPYYYAVAGYTMFGQSVLGAKIMWLLTGAIILGLTFVLARVIGATVGGAFVAMTALAGHRIFVENTTQHIPDMPLILGITIALVCFCKIMQSRDAPPPWLYYLGYGGIAYAILAKGMLALVFLPVLLIVRLIYRRQMPPGRIGHELAAVLLATVLATWWFVAIWLRYPDELVSQFVGDQLTEKASFSVIDALARLRKTITDLFLPFIPFLLAFALGLKWPKPGRLQNPAVALCVFWIVVVLVLFAFSTALFERYILPAAPAAAALIGLYASRFEPALLTKRLGRSIRVFSFLPLVVAGLASYLFWVANQQTTGIGIAITAALLFILSWWIAAKGAIWAKSAILGGTYVLAVAAALPLYFTLIYPMHGHIAANHIKGISAKTYVLNNRRLVDQTGLVTNRIEDIRYLTTIDDIPNTGPAIILATDETAILTLENLGYYITLAHDFPTSGFAPSQLIDALRQDQLDSFRRAYGSQLILAYLP